MIDREYDFAVKNNKKYFIDLYKNNKIIPHSPLRQVVLKDNHFELDFAYMENFDR